MNKIRALLEQMGAKPELAEEIVSAMDEWKEGERQKLMEEFKGRLDKAMKVCVEETEDYKHKMARRVEIFLESQVAAIERSARDRQAIEESKAANDLKRVKAMLEGVNVDGSISEDLQAIKAENEKLRKGLTTVTEQRNKISAKYQQTFQVAKKALGRNKILENQIQNKAKPVSESKNKKSTNLNKARRKKGETKTTRPTITESQTRKTTKPTQSGSGEIERIASSVEDIA